MTVSLTTPLFLPRTTLISAPDSPVSELARACARIAPSEANVLITGETGTGKEVFARYIHEHSARVGKPFVPVNCGAIPDTLIESELFGHTRGAFTGAQQARKGRIAMAEGGTLFLDEIGELQLPLQVKLLRVLQERTYEPVGSSESVPANFRLVAATNRDLTAEVEAGRFRRDLFYRLMVCPLELPALRQRRGDIKPLFMHFWRKRGEARAIEPEVFAALERYSWPGNVRELENLVERLSACVEGTTIRAAHLPPLFQGDAGESRVPHFEPEPLSEAEGPAQLLPLPPRFPVDLPTMLRKLEDDYIDAALSMSQGNKKAAAELLGLQRTTLVEKLRRRG